MESIDCSKGLVSFVVQNFKIHEIHDFKVDTSFAPSLVFAANGPAMDLFSHNLTLDITSWDEKIDNCGPKAAKINHIIKSNEFHLIENEIRRLSETSLKATIFFGADQIDTVEVDLSTILRGDSEFKLELNFSSSVSSKIPGVNGTIDAVLSCNNSTADYCLGSIMMTISELQLKNIPPEWSLSHPDLVGLGADKLEVKLKDLLSIEENQLYSYSLNLEWLFEGDKEFIEKRNDVEDLFQNSLPSISAVNGHLAFSSSKWYIHFQTPLVLGFLHYLSIKMAYDVIQSGVTLCLKVTRQPAALTEETKMKKLKAKKVPPKGKSTPIVEESWTFVANVALKSIVEKDTKTCDFCGLCEYAEFLNQDSEVFQKRKEFMREIETQMSMKILLSRPFSQSNGGGVFNRNNLIELPPARKFETIPEKLSVEAELAKEFEAFINEIFVEYAKLPNSFPGFSNDKNKMEQLFYVLSTNGIYHKYKETLKPCIQRVVRKSLLTANFDSTDQNSNSKQVNSEITRKMYADLVFQANSALNRKIVDVNTQYSLSDGVREEEKLQNFQNSMKEQKTIGLDYEISGQYLRAIEVFHDRISIAEDFLSKYRIDHELKRIKNFQEKASYIIKDCYFDLALCYLRNGNLNSGSQSLLECIRCSYKGTENVCNAKYLELYGAVQMELKNFDKANAIFSSVLELYIPSMEMSESEYDINIYTNYCSSAICSLQCVYFNEQNQPRQAYLSLKRSIAIYTKIYANSEKLEYSGSIGSTVMLELCHFLLEHGLYKCAEISLKISKECELIMGNKRIERGLSNAPSSKKRATLFCIESRILLQVDNEESIILANECARKATQLEPSCFQVWFQHAKSLEKIGAPKQQQVEALENALNLITSTDDTYYTLSICICLGDIYLKLGQFNESKRVYTVGTQHIHTPTLWLGIGTANLELKEYEKSELALQYANRMDVKNSKVWGTLTLLLLTFGDTRVNEAEATLNCALRTGLSDPLLLQQIGEGFAALDRFTLAEAVFRQASKDLL